MPNLSTTELIVGGGLLALLIEQLWVTIAGSLNQRAEKKRLRQFLKGWHADASQYISEIQQSVPSTITEWKEYHARMEQTDAAEEAFPQISYKRFLLPDIAPMVSAGLSHLSEAAYANLLYVNGRLILLDERNKSFSEIFVEMLQTDLSPRLRAKAAKLILQDLEFVESLADQASKYVNAQGLTCWLSQ